MSKSTSKSKSDLEAAVVVIPAAGAADKGRHARRTAPHGAAASSQPDDDSTPSPSATSLPASTYKEKQRDHLGGLGGEATRTPRSGASVHTKKKVRGRDHRGPARRQREHDTTGHVFPPRRLQQGEWRRLSADAMEIAAQSLPHGKIRKSLLRKATALRLCGSRTRILVCRACKTPKAGSGIQTSAGHPCQTRICNGCQRRRGQQRRAELERALNRIKIPKGYSFKQLTLTTRYDPRDESELTVEALVSRIEGLIAAIMLAWKTGLRRKGTGLTFSIEIAGSGHVHLHALFLGPYIPKPWLETVLRSGFDRAGFTHIKNVDEENEKNIVLEIVKYHTKSPSPLCERFFDRGCDVIDPVLAARWEIACHGKHLHRSLGAFRKRKDDVADANPDVEADDPLASDPCPTCGRCDGFIEREVDTFEWVQHCHAIGESAFRSTKRTPRPFFGERPPSWLVDSPPAREVFTL